MIRMATLSGLCCGLLLLTACGDDSGSQDDASSYGGDGGSAGSSSSAGKGGKGGSGGKGGAGGKAAAGAGGMKAAGAGGAAEAGSGGGDEGGSGDENSGGTGGSTSEEAGGKGGSGGKAAGDQGGKGGSSAAGAGGAGGMAAGSGGSVAGAGGSSGAAGAAGEAAGTGGTGGEEAGAGGETGGAAGSGMLPPGGTFLAQVTSDDQAAAVCQAAETKSTFDFGDFTTLRSGICANTGHTANTNSGADCAMTQADCVSKAEMKGAPGGAACTAADLPDCPDVTVDEYVACAAANLQSEFHTFANDTCMTDFSMVEMFTVPMECEAVYQRCAQLMMMLNP